jgi:hypothetical protein
MGLSRKLKEIANRTDTNLATHKGIVVEIPELTEAEMKALRTHYERDRGKNFYVVQGRVTIKDKTDNLYLLHISVKNRGSE